MDQAKRDAAMAKAWERERGDHWIVNPPPIEFEKGFNAGYDAASSAEWVAVDPDTLPEKDGRYLVQCTTTDDKNDEMDVWGFVRGKSEDAWLKYGVAYRSLPAPYTPKESKQ